MVLAVIIAWLVVVLGTSAWVSLRGWRLWVLARAAQSSVEQHAMQAQLKQLPDRLAELERRQQQLAEVMARLQTSIAEFAVLWRAFSTVSGQLRGARSFFTSK
jgi:hypothetical protein